MRTKEKYKKNKYERSDDFFKTLLCLSILYNNFKKTGNKTKHLICYMFVKKKICLIKLTQRKGYELKHHLYSLNSYILDILTLFITVFHLLFPKKYFNFTLEIRAGPCNTGIM